MAAFQGWTTALETILQQPLQVTSPGPKTEAASIFSASDSGTDLFQEFAASSDYYGRDIFDAAKLMVMVRLSTFWAQRGKDGLVGIDKLKVLPIAAYGNLLKAGWILQRLQRDSRSRTEECTAIMVMLSEVSRARMAYFLADSSGFERVRAGIRALMMVQDVTLELRRINELKIALPTSDQLIHEMDLRIWLDDLEESEWNRKQSPPTPEATGKNDDRAESIHRPVAPDLTRESSPQLQSPSQEKFTTPPRSATRLSGAATHPKSPSQASPNGTIMASSGSRATIPTAPSSIDTEQSMFQLPRSPHASPLSPHPGSPSPSRPPCNAPLSNPAPTMARNRPQPFAQPPRRVTIPPDSMQYGVPPLHPFATENMAPGTQRDEERETLSANVSTSSLVRKYLEYSVENMSDLQAYDPAHPPSRPGDYPRAPNAHAASPPPNFADYSRALNHEPIPCSPIAESRDVDERPGEVEIMKAVLKRMILFASDTFDARAVWESCSVRIFRKADMGVRLVTCRDSGMDQRFISLQDTELVPEYGYHKDEPVLYLRRCRAESYQPPTPSRPLSHRDTEDLSAISLYYRFDNAEDMFNFQLAFTGEAVEIDIQAVRTVRFKRNLLDGEHSNYKARVQMWHEQTFPRGGGRGDPTSPSGGSISGTIRSRGIAESILKIPSTRIVIFFEETIIMLFGKVPAPAP